MEGHAMTHRYLIRAPRRSGKRAMMQRVKQLLAEGRVDEARRLIANMPSGPIVFEVNNTGPVKK